MLNPIFDNDDLQNTIHSVQPAIKPGAEGMNPIMLVSSMLVGGGMWMGIFYLGHIFLQAITG